MIDATIELTSGKLEFDLSFSWLLRFERAFKLDAFLFLSEIIKNKDVKPVDIGMLVYAMTGYEDINNGEYLEEMKAIQNEVLTLACTSVVGKPKKEQSETEENEPTQSTMSILVAGIKRGLTLADTKEMTLGMWVDYCTEYNEYLGIESGHTEQVRKATKTDILKFIKTGAVG